MQFNIVEDILIISFLLTFVLAGYDYFKVRRIKTKPFITFLMPTYNDSEYIENAVKGIYHSYDPKKFELFILDDCSNDDTPNILKSLKQKYGFKIIRNTKNKGKALSINDAFPKTKGEIVIVVDSDTVISKEGINDILARFDSNPKIAAVSCRYVPSNKGFLAAMQKIEYGIASIVQAAHNATSTLALWGGCMAFKRDPFESVGRLSQNMLTEDVELALKLSDAGWKVEQSFVPAHTVVPYRLKSWFKQKIRWGGGFIQGFIKHPRVFLKNPLALLFFGSFWIVLGTFLFKIFNDVLLIPSVYSLIKTYLLTQTPLIQTVLSISTLFGITGIKDFYLVIVYPLITIPYILIDVKKFKDVVSLLLIYPFSFIYYPVFALVTIGAFFVGIYKYNKKSNKSAWVKNN